MLFHCVHLVAGLVSTCYLSVWSDVSPRVKYPIYFQHSGTNTITITALPPVIRLKQKYRLYQKVTSPVLWGLHNTYIRHDEMNDILVCLNNTIWKLQKVPPRKVTPVYVKKRAQYPPIKDTRNLPKVPLGVSFRPGLSQSWRSIVGVTGSSLLWCSLADSQLTGEAAINDGKYLNFAKKQN